MAGSIATVLAGFVEHWMQGSTFSAELVAQTTLATQVVTTALLVGVGVWAREHSVPVLSLVGIATASMLLVGCATTPDGDRQVDRQMCLARVEDARAAKLACALIDSAENRERCEIGADIAVSAARLGCSFADDVAVADSE